MPLFPSDFSWGRYLGWARALLAAVALAGTLIRFPESAPLYYAILISYLVYSVVAAFREPHGHGPMLALLALFGDTVFFLIMTTTRNAVQSLWLASVFYLFLLAQAVARHSPREVALVAFASAFFGVLIPGTAVAMLERTVIIGGVLGMAMAISRKRLETRIRTLTLELEEARSGAVKALDAERLRIASDFHDGPLQNFISLQMRLEILRKLLERDLAAGMEELKQLQSISQQQVRELRAFLRGMRPLEVEGGNIFAQARRTAELFQKESGIPVTFVGGTRPTALPPEIAQEILQMLREALHNVQKHAGATRVAVAMERNDQVLEMSVDDNGHGFSFVGTYSLEELDLLKIGPASLKRRARTLNADLMLDSRPGKGAGIKVRVPVQ